MSDWFLYFLFYSLAGCALEKLFARAVRAPKQMRKCFLLLPLCPVYGLAMVLVLALPAPAGFWRLALWGGLVCTGTEYAVHLFYDKVLGVRFWDYSCLRGNILGRVCPQFALVWGLLSAAAVQWVQPVVRILAERTPPVAVYLLWLLFVTDCVCTAALLRRYHDTELLALTAALAQT